MPFVVHVEPVLDRMVLQISDETRDIEDSHSLRVTLAHAHEAFRPAGLRFVRTLRRAYRTLREGRA
jgi:hypothetical protein